MSDRVRKAEARRDFLAGLVVQDETYLPLFIRAENELAIAAAATDTVAAARAIARQRAA